MANVKIFELPLTTSLTNNDDFPINQSGITKRTTISQVISAVKDNINSTGGSGPVGAIMMFPSPTIPSGWLACNGQELDKSDITNLPLFGIIGYTYGGTGNKFNVPDLRGLFVRGWDNRTINNVDPQINRTVGSIQQDSFKSHNHAITTNVGGTLRIPKQVYSFFTAQGDENLDLGFISNTGEAETRPKNIALVYCIKL
jgi:microcystin-dependent protein